MSDEPEFENFKELRSYLNERERRLMEINSDIQRSSHERIRMIEEYQVAFNELCDEIIEAEAIGQLMTVNLTAKMIRDAHGIEEIEGDVEDDE